MTANPLKRYFRQPGLYVQLPTKALWYQNGEVETNDDHQVAVYPMAAIDDIMLNTPDAMLNGHALEKVVQSCVPSVKNIKRLLLPDLEALFVGIKSATNGGKADYDRRCPKCNAENTFDLNCQMLLDSATPVDPSDAVIQFDDSLVVHVKPYDFEMRQLFIRREFEEEKLLKSLELNNAEMDEIDRAALLGESVDRLSQMTFSLVSRSIERIEIPKESITVTDPEHINEWLMGISKAQADMVIEVVNRLNAIGVPKKIGVQCSSCEHQWEDPLSFDPTSFFGKRS